MRPNQNVIKHKPIVHGGITHDIATDVLDFSSNINPLGINARIKKTIRKNLELFEPYPDPKSTLLRDTLESHTKVSASRTIVGNGATEIIYNFCSAFLSNLTPVLMPVPTFGEYEAAVRLAGSKISFFKTMNLQNDLERFLVCIPKNGCIFVCNPNNPTGTILVKKDLEKIVKQAKRYNTITFVDECFIELVPSGDQSIISLVKKYENLVVLRSLTKSFALAGMRLGYCVGSRKIASALNKIKIPWNVSGIAQKVTATALSDLSYLERARKIISREAAFLIREISNIDNLKCYATSTNFILIKTNMDSTLLRTKLLEKKILIRDCKSFRGLGGNHIRIAVRTRWENKKLIEALISTCHH